MEMIILILKLEGYKKKTLIVFFCAYFIKWTFRNLAAQGILKVIKGIIVGKPQDEEYYEEYKTAITQVVVNEEKLNDLPIFYNANFGHAKPMVIIPYGINAELGCENKTIVLMECPTV